MYDYIALRVDANPCDENITDLIAAFLADEGFETFEPDSKGLTAYIRKDFYDKDNVENSLLDFPFPTDLSLQE